MRCAASAEFVAVRLESVARMSGSTLDQSPMFAGSLNCTRYVCPGTALQVILTMLLKTPIPWINGAVTGAALTTTKNELLALRGGMPSSLTRVENSLVLELCSTVGVQVMTP